MIPLVINSTLLREIDEKKLVYRYAMYFYKGEESVTVDDLIKLNLEALLDWDILGDKGLGIYCSKFESLKTRDWPNLINLIKRDKEKIIEIGSKFLKNEDLQLKKILLSAKNKQEIQRKLRCVDPNYTVSGRGKKAKACVYEGREYQSRQQCMYAEGLTRRQLYKYLEKTGQK